MQPAELLGTGMAMRLKKQRRKHGHMGSVPKLVTFGHRQSAFRHKHRHTSRHKALESLAQQAFVPHDKTPHKPLSASSTRHVRLHATLRDARFSLFQTQTRVLPRAHKTIPLFLNMEKKASV